MITKEQIEIEEKYLKNLTDLWFKTQNEELRNIILQLRTLLKDIAV